MRPGGATRFNPKSPLSQSGYASSATTPQHPPANMTMKNAQKLRLKIQQVRDVDGKIVEDDWFVACHGRGILYPYSEDTWVADQLSSRQHNRLMRLLPGQVHLFGEPPEAALSCDPSDEHTLHFPVSILPQVARLLRARRVARRSATQRAASRRNIVAARAALARRAGSAPDTPS